MFRIVCDPSSGSTELCLTEITRSASQIFFVCLVGVCQRNFEPAVCVCVRYNGLGTNLHLKFHYEFQHIVLFFILLHLTNIFDCRISKTCGFSHQSFKYKPHMTL